LKASTQRKIWRWVHIILSVPIVGFIYGPVSKIPRAAFAVQWVFFPVVVISGFWMWKGQAIKKWFKTRLRTSFFSGVTIKRTSVPRNGMKQGDTSEAR
jgi:hypothetical protein